MFTFSFLLTALKTCLLFLILLAAFLLYIKIFRWDCYKQVYNIIIILLHIIGMTLSRILAILFSYLANISKTEK